MSLLVDAIVVVGGIAAGRWIARAIRARRSRARGTPESSSSVAPKREDPFAPFPCKLGDVVVRVVERDEAWLAGALVFEEDRPVAVLFVAPEAGTDRAVLAHDSPDEALSWLAPLSEGTIELPAEPPHSIEYAGARFSRARRRPVRVVRLGSGAPSVGDRAVVAEYEGLAAERIVVVAGTEQTLAWRGTVLGTSEYEILPSG